MYIVLDAIVNNSESTVKVFISPSGKLRINSSREFIEVDKEEMKKAVDILNSQE